jgi:hypothetical protein
MYTYFAPIERIEQALRQTEGDLLALVSELYPDSDFSIRDLL